MGYIELGSKDDVSEGFTAKYAGQILGYLVSKDSDSKYSVRIKSKNQVKRDNLKTTEITEVFKHGPNWVRKVVIPKKVAHIEYLGLEEMVERRIDFMSLDNILLPQIELDRLVGATHDEYGRPFIG